MKEETPAGDATLAFPLRVSPAMAGASSGRNLGGRDPRAQSGVLDWSAPVLEEEVERA